MKFRVGDIVVVTTKTYDNETDEYVQFGRTGEITSIELNNSDWVYVKYINDKSVREGNSYMSDQIELEEIVNTPLYKAIDER